MIQDLNKLEEKITESTAWEKTNDFLGLHMDIAKDISISILDLLIVITVIFITTIVLRIIVKNNN